MRILIKYLMFIFLVTNLEANVVIHNYTTEPLTATFYYGSEPAKMQFSIAVKESAENAIPSWTTSRRILKITTKDGKELTLKPAEWFSDKIFYITLENNLKAYTQREWESLTDEVKKKLTPHEIKPLFRASHYETKDITLADVIPAGENKNEWIMVSNQDRKKIYAAFYYQGTITDTLKKAVGPIYSVEGQMTGYAKLPAPRFVTQGPRVIVYAYKGSALVDTIKKENYNTIQGIVAVGLGQGSIALLSPSGSDSQKSIPPIKIKPLNIILKTDSTLYYALYTPVYKGFLESAKDFLQNLSQKKDSEIIESFQRYRGPEKMTPNHKHTIEGAHTALAVFSANPDSLTKLFLTTSNLQTSKDISFIPCQNNEYLIIAKPQDTIFIYTPEQWKEALDKTAAPKPSFTQRIGLWFLNKFLRRKK